MSHVVVLDFDGVLVDSNQLKYDAFFELFSPPGQEVVRRILTENRETPRETLVRDVLRTLGSEAADAQVHELTSRYDALVWQGILRLGVAPAVRTALAALAVRYPLYVNSATPHASLRAQVAELDLARYFCGVFGSPPGKADNLASVMSLESAGSDNIIAVGDGESDRRAAAQCGLRFIGVTNEFNGWQGDEFTVIAGLEFLPQLLLSGL